MVHLLKRTRNNILYLTSNLALTYDVDNKLNSYKGDLYSRGKGKSAPCTSVCNSINFLRSCKKNRYSRTRNNFQRGSYRIK